jgi:hypothetical protein
VIDSEILKEEENEIESVYIRKIITINMIKLK